MTFRLCSGISAFGDRLVLRALDSLKGLERAFIIEGRYSNFPMPQDYSDTAIQQAIMANYQNTHLTHFVGSEPEKRSKYLQLAAEYGFDAILIIDSDEYIVGDVSKFMQNAEELYRKRHPRVACVECRGYVKDHPELTGQPGQPKKMWARLVFDPAGLKYDSLLHSRVVDGNGRSYEMTHEGNYPLVEGISIIHSASERDPVYTERRNEYHEWLMTKEAGDKT